MKKMLTLLMSAVIIILFTSCSANSATVAVDNSSRSKFIDFYTEDEYVFIECELNVYSDNDTKVKLSAVDEDDVKTGLIKNPKLTGINKEDNSDEFVLKKGENTVTVLFRGDYAGIPEITEREIPRFIYIEK